MGVIFLSEVCISLWAEDRHSILCSEWRSALWCSIAGDKTGILLTVIYLQEIQIHSLSLILILYLGGNRICFQEICPGKLFHGRDRKRYSASLRHNAIAVQLQSDSMKSRRSWRKKSVSGMVIKCVDLQSPLFRFIPCIISLEEPTGSGPFQGASEETSVVAGLHGCLTPLAPGFELPPWLQVCRICMFSPYHCAVSSRF